MEPQLVYFFDMLFVKLFIFVFGYGYLVGFFFSIRLQSLSNNRTSLKVFELNIIFLTRVKVKVNITDEVLIV